LRQAIPGVLGDKFDGRAGVVGKGGAKSDDLPDKDLLDAGISIAKRQRQRRVEGEQRIV
jgi:hypothetical protein